ncbi:MAG TPA: hypothetical protein VFZ00_08760 [Solirubrobacter sp.]|nr:hypothetical protein [Solirubrobacter sp.]
MRAVETKCVAPSEIIDQATAGIVGGIAEKIIEADYIARMGSVPFATDFFDVGGAVPYIAFLAAHNPSVDVPLLAVQAGLSGGVLIPDILADNGTRKEYYEIKPNSVDGRPAGRAKLAAIAAFMAFNTLPYVPGTTYVPTPRIPLPGVGAIAMAALNAPALACGPPEISLEPILMAPGLIVYRICITADFECILKVIALEALAAAVIAAIIASEGALAPVLVPVLAPVGL